MIDPAYNKTSYLLNSYPEVDEDELFSVVNFDDFMRDGFISLWVVNSLMDKMIRIMNKKGWKRIEWVVWNKYDRYGKMLTIGGHYAWHVNKLCLVFRRKVPFEAKESFKVEKSFKTSINTKMEGMQVSQKPF